MIEVQIIRTDVMLNEALALRVEVFVDEQKVPKTEEVDYLDNVSSIENKKVIHIVALFQQRIVGTARLIFDVPENEYPHIGRVAVKKEFRGRNIGRTIMDKLHQITKKKSLFHLKRIDERPAVGWNSVARTLSRRIILMMGYEEKD